MGKKRRDGRAAKRGNNSSSSNAEARNSHGGGSATASLRYNGGIYEGERKDGFPHGEGKMTYVNGEWKEGVLHGKGTMKYPSGNVYEGEWKDDRHGWGTFTWANGDVYEGQWVEGEEQGRGTFKRAEDDRVYEGEFANGQMHGWGISTWPSGAMHEGHWEDGNMHGKGTGTLPTGEIFEGIWMKGEFVQRELRSQRSQQRRLEAATKNCDHCGVDDGRYKLRVCSGCNLALYCSAACQKAASRSHRRICDIASMLPSRDSDELELVYDRETMVDLDAGLRYATKYMDSLKHLKIDLMKMVSGDAPKLSAKQLPSLLKSKKGALDSLFLTSDDRHPEVHVTFEHDTVWKELYRLKQLRLDYMSFDDVHLVRDVVHRQSSTVMVLCLPHLQIDWHKAKCRRMVAEAVNSCKHLVKLDMDGSFLMDSDLKVMLQGLPSLRVLHLSRASDHSHEFTNNTCGLIARKCPGLQLLDLLNHDQLSVRGVSKIFEGCPHLRSFWVSTPKLSGKDVQSLLSVAPQLMYLALVGNDLSAGELDDIIEATGGRTAFSIGLAYNLYDPEGEVISSETREKYDRQIDVLNKIWPRQDDPKVANEWDFLFEG